MTIDYIMIGPGNRILYASDHFIMGLSMRRTIGILALLFILSIIPLMDTGESAPPMVTINEPMEGEFLPAGNITLKWSAQFDQTELDHFEIRINDGNWTDVGVNSTINITDAVSGNNTASVKAFDNETFGEANVSFFIDDVAPMIEITSPIDSSLLNTSAVNVTWNIIEEGSGIGMIRIRLDEGPWIFTNETDYKKLPSASDGNHSIMIEAVDNVGNSCTSSINFSIDTIPPSVIDFGPMGTNIERDEAIFIDIGEEIDAFSVEFYIVPDVPGRISFAPTRIEFIPDNYLDAGIEYTIITRFSDHAGNQVGPYEWEFTIADYYLEGLVKGYVVDKNGEYVLGAMVTIGNITGFTDIFGRFDLEVMPGELTIIIEKEGYTAYTGNLTLLPTQEVDLGKLILEGGTSPVVEEDDEKIPWLPIVIIGIIVGGLAIGYMTMKKRKSSEDLDIEE